MNGLLARGDSASLGPRMELKLERCTAGTSAPPSRRGRRPAAHMGQRVSFFFCANEMEIPKDLKDL